MQFLKTVVTGISLQLLLTVALAKQTPAVPDTVAQFWKRIERAKTVTYTVRSWRQDTFRTHGAVAGKTVFYVAGTYEIKVRRPNLLSIVRTPALQEYEITEEGKTHKAFENYGDDIFTCDGKQSISRNSYFRSYTVGKAPKTLKEMKDDSGNNVPSGWLKDAMNWFYDDQPLDGYKQVSDADFAATGQAVYLLESPSDPGRRQKIYFDSTTGQLTRISRLVKDSKDVWHETDRTEFRFWDFDVPLPAYIFDSRPPRNYRPWDEMVKEMKAKK